MARAPGGSPSTGRRRVMPRGAYRPKGVCAGTRANGALPASTRQSSLRVASATRRCAGSCDATRRQVERQLKTGPNEWHPRDLPAALVLRQFFEPRLRHGLQGARRIRRVSTGKFRELMEKHPATERVRRKFGAGLRPALRTMG